MPRIPPLQVADFTDEQAELGGGRGNPRCELNFTRALVQHPALYRSWIPFAEHLVFNSTLPGRDREILIIRASERCGEKYEAAHHIHIGHTLGLTDADIAAVKSGAAALPAFEQALVQAADDLIDDYRISDKTWEALAARYSRQQIMETVFVVANYALMAMVTNSFDITPEQDVENSWKPF